jgi:hypothetical protein
LIASDKEVVSPCVSLKGASSLDSIVTPFIPCCVSLAKKSLRKSIRHRTRPQRYQDNDIVSNLRHNGTKRKKCSLAKLNSMCILDLSFAVN